ncbi:putative E3 ubiquitin-protein ligase HERC2 [Paratrimastix pyriformis]|uniref:E3 ubiquitin-protein ligase HERC2 n=1 Tax=Paratrimastix pyriformis TaxID=342808 RepID=A0ABQ8UH86_9EUKA|nr:putative E3 ubiquitin-protein ligase HERC2 [Paratrimastix pyriformis]
MNGFTSLQHTALHPMTMVVSSSEQNADVTIKRLREASLLCNGYVLSLAWTQHSLQFEISPGPGVQYTFIEKSSHDHLAEEEGKQRAWSAYDRFHNALLSVDKQFKNILVLPNFRSTPPPIFPLVSDADAAKSWCPDPSVAVRLSMAAFAGPDAVVPAQDLATVLLAKLGELSFAHIPPTPFDPALALPTRVPFVVELHQDTFGRLGRLFGQLTELFFAIRPATPDAEVRRLADGLLGLMRVLRLNIIYLAKGMVDYAAVGLTPESRETFQKLLFRYINGELPAHPLIQKAIGAPLISESIDILTNGMDVFFDTTSCHALLKELLNSFLEASNHAFAQDGHTDPAAAERLQRSLKLMSSMLSMLSGQIADIMLPSTKKSAAAQASPAGPAAAAPAASAATATAVAASGPAVDPSKDLAELWDKFLEAHTTESRLLLNQIAAGTLDAEEPAPSSLSTFLQNFQRHFLSLFLEEKAPTDPAAEEAEQTPNNTQALLKAPAGTPLTLLPTTYPARKGIEAHALFEYLRQYAASLLRRGEVLLQAAASALAEAKTKRPEQQPQFVDRALHIIRHSLVGTMVRPFVTSLHMLKGSLLMAGQLVGPLTHMLKALDEIVAQLKGIEALEQEYLENEAGSAPAALTEVIKTGHPYQNNEDWTKSIRIPGATGYKLRFDPRTQTENRYDWMRVYTKEGADQSESVHMITGTDFPHNVVTIMSPLLVFQFHSDGSNTEWGVECEVTAIITEKFVALPWLLDMAKTVARQACACAGQLLASTPLTDIERNPHAAALVNCELLKGGLDEQFLTLFEKHYRDQEGDVVGTEASLAALLKSATPAPTEGTPAPSPSPAAGVPAILNAPALPANLVEKRTGLERLAQKALEEACARSAQLKTEGMPLLQQILMGDPNTDGGKLVAYLAEHEPKPFLAARVGAVLSVDAMRAGLVPLLYTDSILFAEAQAAVRLLTTPPPPPAAGATGPAVTPDPIGARLKAAWKSTECLVSWLAEQRQRTDAMTADQLVRRLRNLATILLHTPSPSRRVEPQPNPLLRGSSNPLMRASSGGAAPPMLSRGGAAPPMLSRGPSKEGSSLNMHAVVQMKKLASFRRVGSNLQVADVKTSLIMNFLRYFTEAEVVCLLAARRDRARCRIQGLKNFKTLVGSVKDRVLSVDILRGLTRAWAQMENPHYMVDLEGIGSLAAQVGGAFTALYTDLMGALTAGSLETALDARIRATALVTFNLAFRTCDTEYLKQIDLVAHCVKLMALPHDVMHFNELRSAATALFRSLTICLFEEEKRPEGQPATAFQPSEYQRLLLKTLCGMVDTAAQVFREDRENVLLLRAQFEGEKPEAGAKKGKKGKEPKAEERRGRSLFGRVASAVTAVLAKKPEEGAAAPAAAATATATAEEKPQGKPKPPVEDIQAYNVLSLLLVLLRKQPRIAGQLALAVVPSLISLIGTATPRVQRAAARILTAVLPSLPIENAPRIGELSILDYLMDFSAIPEYARLPAGQSPTALAETTAYQAGGLTQTALGEIAQGHPIYSTQEHLLELEKDKKKEPESASENPEDAAHVEASRIAYPLRDISAQSTRALGTAVQATLNQLLMADIEAALPGSHADEWRTNLRTRTSAAIKALPTTLLTAFPWLVEVKKRAALAPGAPVPPESPVPKPEEVKEAILTLLRTLVMLKSLAVGGTAQPITVGARVLDNNSSEEGTVVAFNMRDPMCKVVFDSTAKLAPRDCRVDSLQVVGKQAPVDPDEFPEPAALLRSLVEVLELAQLNQQAVDESRAARSAAQLAKEAEKKAKKDKKKRAPEAEAEPESEKPAEEEAPKDELTAAIDKAAAEPKKDAMDPRLPTLSGAHPVQVTARHDTAGTVALSPVRYRAGTLASATLLLSSLRTAVMSVFSVLTLSHEWIALIIEEHLVSSLIPLVLAPGSRDPLRALVARCAALSDRIFTDGLEVAGAPKASGSSAPKQLGGTRYEDAAFSNWGGEEIMGGGIRMAVGICNRCKHICIPTCRSCDVPFVQPLYTKRGTVQCTACRSVSAIRELECAFCRGTPTLYFGIFSGTELLTLSGLDFDHNKDRTSAFLRCPANQCVMRLPTVSEGPCNWDWKLECLRAPDKDIVSPTVFKQPELPEGDIWEFANGKALLPRKPRAEMQWQMVPFNLSKKFADEVGDVLRKVGPFGSFKEVAIWSQIPARAESLLRCAPVPEILAQVRSVKRTALLPAQEEPNDEIFDDTTAQVGPVVSLKPSVLLAMVQSFHLAEGMRVLVVGGECGVLALSCAKLVGKTGWMLALTAEGDTVKRFDLYLRTDPIHWAVMVKRSLFAYKPGDVAFDRVILTDPAPRRAILHAASLLKADGQLFYPDRDAERIAMATRTSPATADEITIADNTVIRLDSFSAVFPRSLPEQPDVDEKTLGEIKLELTARQCVDCGVCTHQGTGDNFTKQPFFACETCRLTGKLGVCQSCMTRCHAGHRLSLTRVALFYCDCPDSKVPASSRRGPCRSWWPEDAPLTPVTGRQVQYAWVCPSLDLSAPHYCCTHYARLLTWAGHPCLFRGKQEFECEGGRLFENLNPEKAMAAREEEAKFTATSTAAAPTEAGPAATAGAAAPATAAAAAAATATAPAVVEEIGDRMRIGLGLAASEMPPLPQAAAAAAPAAGEEGAAEEGEEAGAGEEEEGPEEEEEDHASVHSDGSDAPAPIPPSENVELADEKTIAPGQLYRLAKGAEVPHAFGGARPGEYNGLLCIVRKVAAPRAFVEIMHPELGLCAGQWVEIRCLEKLMSPANEAAASSSSGVNTQAILDEATAMKLSQIPDALVGAEQSVAQKLAGSALTQLLANWPVGRPFTQDSFGTPEAMFDMLKSLVMTLGEGASANEMDMLKTKMTQWLREDFERHKGRPVVPVAAPAAAAAAPAAEKKPAKAKAEKKPAKKVRFHQERQSGGGLFGCCASYQSSDDEHSGAEEEQHEEEEHSGSEEEHDDEEHTEKASVSTAPESTDEEDDDEEEEDEGISMAAADDGSLITFLMSHAMHLLRTPGAIRKALRVARSTAASAATQKKSGMPAALDMTKVVVEESNHNYSDNMDYRTPLRVAGARGLRIIFDRRCRTEANCDRLFFHRSSDYNSSIRDFHGTGAYDSFVIPNVDTVYFQFRSDGSSNDWGWKFYVVDASATEEEGPAAAPSSMTPEQRALRGALEFSVWVLQLLLEQPVEMCPALYTKATFTRVVRALTVVPDKHPLFLQLVSIITRLLSRWDQTWDIVSDDDQELVDMLGELTSGVRGMSNPQLRNDGTLPANIYAQLELVAAVATAERLQEEKDKKAEAAKKAAESGEPAAPEKRLSEDDLAMYPSEMDFTQCLIEVARIHECFREKKPLPPSLFATAYWNMLHDRIIESPHPYTTNWQTMVRFPNARRIDIAVDPRFAVDRDHNHAVLLSKTAFGRDDIVKLTERSSEPLRSSTDKLFVKLEAPSAPSSERNFGCFLAVHPDYEPEFVTRSLMAKRDFVQQLYDSMCDYKVWSTQLDGALFDAAAHYAFQMGTEHFYVSPDMIFSGGVPVVAATPAPSATSTPVPAASPMPAVHEEPVRLPSALVNMLRQQPSVQYGLNRNIPTPAPVEGAAAAPAAPGEAPAPEAAEPKPAEEEEHHEEEHHEAEEEEHHEEEHPAHAEHEDEEASEVSGRASSDDEEESEDDESVSMARGLFDEDAASHKSEGHKSAAGDELDPLVGLPVNALCLRYHLLRVYNWLVSRSLIGFNLGQLTNPWSLASGLAANRQLISGEVKMALWSEHIERSKYAGGMPSVTVNRTRNKQNPENTIFVQMMDQFTSMDRTRQLRSTNRAFQVKFVGEGATDQGGPYRESLSDMANELTARTTVQYQGGLPLLVPCSNRIHNVGQNRDCYVVDASSTEPRVLAMFRFLGKLMGIAIRTKVSAATQPRSPSPTIAHGHAWPGMACCFSRAHIPSLPSRLVARQNPFNLDLAPIVWKHLVNQKPEVADVEAIDEAFTQGKMIREWATPDDFDSLDLHWAVLSSAGKEVPLRPNGAEQPVSFEERCAYVDACEKFRLDEGLPQIAEIRRGICQIVPGDVLGILTWRELERRVCGSPEVDIPTLRRFTKYSGWEASSPTMAHLWRALESFTQEQRRAYLRFVTGRSRMPPPEEFANNMVEIQRFGHGGNGSVDGYLPVSHTCFNSIEVPAYSSYEALRTKFLYAITQCTSIDNDFQATGGFEQEE